MKVVKINFKKNSKKSPSTPFIQRGLNTIADFFRRGKVVVYPTDTIYGLGCLATNRKAIDRIYKIKKRERRKPLLILVSDLAMAKKYCYVSKEQERYLRRVWKIPITPFIKRAKKKSPYTPFIKGGSRPVTVILKNRRNLPKELTGGADNLAVRLPKNDFLIKIIKAVGASIVSTSANLSGEKPLQNVGSIEKHFKSLRSPFVKGGNSGLPDLIINAGALNNKPSRIVDITDIKKIKVLRN